MAEQTAVKECWCGVNHNADGQNGNFKHWVMNWALYRLRMDDLELAHKPKPKPKRKPEEVKDEVGCFTGSLV